MTVDQLLELASTAILEAASLLPAIIPSETTINAELAMRDILSLALAHIDQAADHYMREIAFH